MSGCIRSISQSNTTVSQAQNRMRQQAQQDLLRNMRTDMTAAHQQQQIIMRGMANGTMNMMGKGTNLQRAAMANNQKCVCPVCAFEDGVLTCSCLFPQPPDADACATTEAGPDGARSLRHGRQPAAPSIAKLYRQRALAFQTRSARCRPLQPEPTWDVAQRASCRTGHARPAGRPRPSANAADVPRQRR